MDPRPLTRRRLLAGAGVAVISLAGCSGTEDRSGPEPSLPTTAPPTSPAPDPDAAVISRVRRDVAGLLGAYRVVLLRHPGVRRDLQPLAAHLETYADIFGRGRQPARARAPGRDVTAVAWLRVREQRSSLARRADAVAATSGDLARVLAAMAAGQAQHVEVLDELRRRLSRVAAR